MGKYLLSKDIDFNLYEKEELKLINKVLSKDNNIKFKQCAKCQVYYPMASSFFRTRKTLTDGFYNTCKKCSGHEFTGINNFFDGSLIKEEIILYYEKYLNDNLTSKEGGQLISLYYEVIIKYLINDKYKMNTDDIYNNIDRQWLKQNKLYGLSIHQFNGSTIDLLISVFPDLKPWLFKQGVPDNYWDNIENVKNALEWFIKQLFNDNIINSIDDIPKVMCNELIIRYKLSGLSDYYGHPYNIIKVIYPNKFDELDYITIPQGFWDIKENRIRVFKQLIEKELKINIKDITKVLSYEYIHLDIFNTCKRLLGIINRYYNLNIWQYINECYSYLDLSSKPYKNGYITLDNIKVKSEPERMLHHLFIFNNQYDIQYEVGQIRNEIESESYRPDWCLYIDNKIIFIEYYGMLNMTNVDFGYDEKYKRKKEYYNNLCNVHKNIEYIEVFPADLVNSYQGVINKMAEHNIYLEVFKDYKELNEKLLSSF